MEKKINVLPPIMPNYIMLDLEPLPGLKQDGIKANLKIAVSDLTEGEAIEFGELMKITFMEHQKKRKDTPINPFHPPIN